MSTLDNTPYKLSDWVYSHSINEFWSRLSSNPGAIHLLEQNQDKINWTFLSGNPNAIYLLEQHPDKVNWKILSSNPGAIDLIELNLDKIDWN